MTTEAFPALSLVPKSEVELSVLKKFIQKAGLKLRFKKPLTTLNLIMWTSQAARHSVKIFL